MFIHYFVRDRNVFLDYNRILRRTLNWESPICCYNRMKGEWLLLASVKLFVTLLKPGPFCSLLMGVQAAFDNRGRPTISVNYRIVPKIIFVNVISLVLTRLCGKLSRTWNSRCSG